MELREDMVNQGLSLLTNKEVYDTQLSEKIKFLEQKGLNTSEILTALKRLTADTSAGINPGLLGMTSGGGYSNLIWDVLIPNALVLSVGAVMYFLCGEKDLAPEEVLPPLFSDSDINNSTPAGISNDFDISNGDQQQEEQEEEEETASAGRRTTSSAGFNSNSAYTGGGRVRETGTGAVTRTGRSTSTSNRRGMTSMTTTGVPSATAASAEIELSVEAALTQLLEQSATLTDEVHDLHLQMQLLLNSDDDDNGQKQQQQQAQEKLHASVAQLQANVTQLLEDRNLVPVTVTTPVPVSVSVGIKTTSLPMSDSNSDTVVNREQHLPAVITFADNGDVQDEVTQEGGGAGAGAVSCQERIEKLLASVVAFVTCNMTPSSQTGIADHQQQQQQQLTTRRALLRTACLTLQMYFDKITEVLATVDSIKGQSEASPASAKSVGSRDALLSRYRKISTNNNVFSRSLRQAVQGYEPVLLNVGFFRRMNAQQQLTGYEYEWGLTSNTTATALGHEHSQYINIYPTATQARLILQAARQSLAVVLSYCNETAVMPPPTAGGAAATTAAAAVAVVGYDSRHDTTETMRAHNRQLYALLWPEVEVLPVSKSTNTILGTNDISVTTATSYTHTTPIISDNKV